MNETRSEVHEETRAPIEVVLTRVITWVFGAIEVLLGLRFLLKLFGANADAAFVEFVYRMTALLMMPFDAVFKTSEVEGAVLDWSVLLAMLVYALIGWGLVALVRAVSPRRGAGTYERIERH